MENQEFTSTNQTQEPEKDKKSEMNEKLGAVGWGLFFIWIGIVWLLKIESGITLLGIGAIILGMQWVRNSLHLKLEGSWVVIGVIFMLSGIWGLFTVKLPLAPIVIIGVGVVKLVSIVREKNKLQ